MSEKDQTVVPRAEMVKGYEFEKDRFVLFTPEELKALEEASSPAIEIMAFIPEKSVDPLFYDKAYLLAPDKRGGKPYALLAEAMRKSGRCALAKWAWKAKQYVVQVRPVEDGLVLQQLLYADEVRSLKDLDIEPVTVSPAELQLALQLIDQISAGQPTTRRSTSTRRRSASWPRSTRRSPASRSSPRRTTKRRHGAQVIDLMDALRASLGKKAAAAKPVAVEPAAAAAADAPRNARAPSARVGRRAPKAAAPPAPRRGTRAPGSDPRRRRRRLDLHAAPRAGDAGPVAHASSPG